MLKLKLINALAEPFPQRCQLLNYILDSAAPGKDLYTTFELLVDFIFTNSHINGPASNGNLILTSFGSTEANRPAQEAVRPPSWPLKLLNRTNQQQHKVEYDCMLQFLNSKSSLWSAMFKLEQTGALFNVSCNSLPTNIKCRIESGQSFFSSKVDTFNVLNLTAIEYYLFYFFMLMHDTKNSSRRIYDEESGTIEIDSLYADLLMDYLNFFLPLNTRLVSFPSSTLSGAAATTAATPSTFTSSASKLNNPPNFVHNQSANNIMFNPVNLNTSTSRIYYSPHHTSASPAHPSLLKRVVMQPKPELLTSEINNNSIDYYDESNSFVDSPKKSNLHPSVSSLRNEQIEMIKKVDLFLRLVNELLLLPFTSLTSIIFPDTPAYFKSNQKTKISSSPQSSPIKYNEAMKQNLANMEIVFALSMILKHSHLFATPLSEDPERFSKEYSQYRIADEFVFPLEELKLSLFKNYWRKSFYKFFEFHLDHLSITPNIKWYLELWLAYIQPWKFNRTVIQQNDLLLDDAANFYFEFIKQNYLVYSDIYSLIMKRFCFVDMTIVDNIQLMQQILAVFTSTPRGDDVKKCSALYQNAVYQLISPGNSRHDIQHLIRHNHDIRLVYNSMIELDKPLHLFKSMFDFENQKIILTMYQNLLTAKDSFTSRLQFLENKAKSRGMWNSVCEALFDNEPQNQFSKFTNSDMEQIVLLIENCLGMMQRFYEPEIDFEYQSRLLLNQTSTRVTNLNQTELADNEPEYSTKTRLTPQDRYKLINRLEKPKPRRKVERAPAESRFLVHILNWVENLLANEFGDTLNDIYNRDDTIGHLSHRILYRPELTHQNGNGTAKSIAQPGARINLRPLASQRFLPYYISFAVLMYLATSLVSFKFTLMLISVLVLLYFV